MDARRIVLALGALEIFGVGLVYLVAPRAMMAGNGVIVDTVNLAHAVRAGYGGLFVAFGALFALGAWSARWTRPALVALFVFMAGFAFGRIVSMLADGAPVGLLYGVLASEIILGGAAFALLRSEARRGA